MILRGEVDGSQVSRHRIAKAVGAVLLLGAGACRETPKPAPAAVSAAPTPASAPASAATASARAATTARPVARASASAPPAPSGPAPKLPAGALGLGPKAIDVATGSFASLAEGGLVIRKRDGELVLVKLGDKPGSAEGDGSTFSRTRSATVDRGGGKTAVYWVDGGKLKRRTVDANGDNGPLEVVADDAEDGYPPHAVRTTGAKPVELAGYVARRATKDGERRAKLWVEGRGSHALSPEGSGGASVWLTLLSDDRVHAAWLDQRTAMTPVHVATVSLAGDGVTISTPVVAWNAPPSDQVSLVSSVLSGGAVVALMAGPKNGSDFGLAAVPIDDARPADDALWLDYPNGLDPAPVVPARFCGLPAAVIVKPTARPIDAPRAVSIVTVEASGRVTERAEVARAARIDHLAAWGSADGGWIAWAGDGRTLVRRVRCGK